MISLNTSAVPAASELSALLAVLSEPALAAKKIADLNAAQLSARRHLTKCLKPSGRYPPTRGSGARAFKNSGKRRQQGAKPRLTITVRASATFSRRRRCNIAVLENV